MNVERWYRVNKKRRCSICDHPDWCTYQDGAVCCMRVKSETPMRNGGYLHKTDIRIPYTAPARKAIEDKPLDARAMWERWFKQTDFYRLDGLGMLLGVDTDCLKAIGCAWSTFNAWAFPMKNASGDVIGIRLRNDKGDKWAVKGSKSGIFIPLDYHYMSDGVLYLVEGPTDLAAAMTIGLQAIGRAACLGQEEMILGYIARHKIRRLVIVTDNDGPGVKGAEKLRSMLSISSCLWLPPVKDIREFVNLGGNYADMQASLKDLRWSKGSQ